MTMFPRITWKTSRPQVKVLNGTLTVPVKRVTCTFTVWRFTFTVAYQASPVIPEAFRDGQPGSETPSPARIRTT